MRQTDHLKAHQFRKGRSGNPGGRPKGLLTHEIREILNLSKGANLKLKSGQTIANAIAWALVRGALSGDIACIREIMIRTEGPAVRDPAELTITVKDAWDLKAAGDADDATANETAE